MDDKTRIHRLKLALLREFRDRRIENEDLQDGGLKCNLAFY